MSGFRVKLSGVVVEDEGMDAPKITAADLKAAATRLTGTVVHDIASVVSGPAVYVPRLAVFAAIDDIDEVLGEDDGTLIDLLDGTPARDVIAQHGTAGRAAAALNARVRAAWSA